MKIARDEVTRIKKGQLIQFSCSEKFTLDIKKSKS